MASRAGDGHDHNLRAWSPGTFRRAIRPSCTGPAASLPFDTVTVFYKLPANVDSMSVEAIIKRFGVSREMADFIVASREKLTP